VSGFKLGGPGLVRNNTLEVDLKADLMKKRARLMVVVGRREEGR
jgi:hypothetical protein